MNKILLIFLFFVISCGFEEVKRKEVIQNVLVIPSKKNEETFLIKNILEEKFNTTKNPEYKLTLEMTENINASGFGSDIFTTNFTLTISINFKLIEISSGKVIFSSNVSGSTNYLSNRENVIAEYSSKKFANKNVSEALAGKIYDLIQNNFGFEVLK
jgi:hypothetical protein